MKDIKNEFIEELCKCPAVSGNALKIALILMDKSITQKEICDFYNYKKAAVSMSIQKLWEMGIVEKKQIHTSDVYYSNLSWRYKSLKLLGWNINGRSNMKYVIPEFISKVIINRNADIVIINEFSSVDSKFLKTLNDAGYFVLYNQVRNDDNKVLIAIKDKIAGNAHKDSAVEKMANNSKKAEPNFLQVTIEYNEKPLTIIGTRIRIDDGSEKDYKERKKQLDSLIDHLTYRENTIILGDFNNSLIRGDESKNYVEVFNEYKGKCTEYYNYHMLKDDFKKIGYNLHTPKGNVNSWSGYIKNDHIVASENIQVSSTEYSWKFIENNNYNGVKSDNSKSWEHWRTEKDRIGYPDHAILTATIQV